MRIHWKRNLGPADWKVLAIIIVAVAITLMIAMPGGRGRVLAETPTASPTASSGAAPVKKPTPTGNPELTSSAGRYACSGGTSFTLTTYANGTARVTGGVQSSTATKVLTKTSIGIWRSDDLSVQVREVAGYTILLENNVTTRDGCRLQ